MNRRGFIGRMFGAVAAAVMAKPAAKALLSDKPIVAVNSLEIGGVSDSFTRITWSNIDLPDYRWWARTSRADRRVLVMRNWRNAANPALARSPRIALAWEETPFESLKKGDHFRLIDKVYPNVVYSMPAEEGRTVYVASGDATTKPGAAALGVKMYDIGIVTSYAGRGAGFDWYEIEWPIEFRGTTRIRPAHARGPAVNS
jgi:hypothetical protein